MNNQKKYKLTKTLTQHGGVYGLKWFRGTNTTIFLSQYFNNGKLWLMSKGTQLLSAMVPMSETVDGGITSPIGVNWHGISGYSDDNKFRESCTYAKKTVKFDVSRMNDNYRGSVERAIKNSFNNSPTVNFCQYVMSAVISGGRISQFTNESIFSNLPEQTKSAYREKINFIIHKCVASLEILSRRNLFKDIAEDYKEYIDPNIISKWDGDKALFIDSLCRRKLGLPMADCYTSMALRERPPRTIINVSGRKGTFWYDGFETDITITIMIWINYLDTLQQIYKDDKQINEYYGQYAGYVWEHTATERNSEIIVGLDILKGYYNISNTIGFFMNDNYFPKQITEDDKQILENPIPLIVGKKTDTNMERTISETNETLVLNKEPFGKDGICTIICSSSHKQEIEKILVRYNLSNEMEIITDDTNL